MLEELEVALPEEELKRADHLVYVSLKYTRTCDIMKNAIKRLIVACELAMIEYLEAMKKKRKINEVPGTAKERTIKTKNMLGSSVNKYLVLYNLLKKIEKSDYTAYEEFRKNVTLRTKGVKPIEVKVENLYDYLEKTKAFVRFMKEKVA